MVLVGDDRDAVPDSPLRRIDFGAQREEGLVHYTAGSWPIGEAEVRAFTAMDVPRLGLPKARIATSDTQKKPRTK